MASLQHHVVAFPFMSQGHTLPLLDLSMAISRFGVRVTIITTPSNAPSIQQQVSGDPNVAIAIFPFPRVDSIPANCENVSHLPSKAMFVPFVDATKFFMKPFEDFLSSMIETGSAPLCVISDFFFDWTLNVCKSLGIPRISFNGMGVLTKSIFLAAHQNVMSTEGGIGGERNVDKSCIINLKTLGISLPFDVYESDIPTLGILKDQANPWGKTMIKIDDAEKNSWGVLVNSFEGLEGDYVASLERFHAEGVKVCCIGPGLLWRWAHQSNLPRNSVSYPYMAWLDKMMNERDGVIYVSFGSQSHVSNKQMDEIARGLENSGKAFIWVVRPTSWTCSDIGWEKRVRNQGLVLHEWVHQQAILSHPSVRGFMSHCGWNSVLESLSFGVPILAYPLDVDQPLNARVVANGFGAGIMLNEEGGAMENIDIEANLISARVKELMEGERGRQVREKAKGIEKKAKEAVAIGGSSYKKLEELIESLKREKGHTERF